MGLQGPNGTLGIKSGLAACKASALPTELFLWPQIGELYLCVLNLFILVKPCGNVPDPKWDWQWNWKGQKIFSILHWQQNLWYDYYRKIKNTSPMVFWLDFEFFLDLIVFFILFWGPQLVVPRLLPLHVCGHSWQCCRKLVPGINLRLLNAKHVNQSFKLSLCLVLVFKWLSLCLYQFFFPFPRTFSSDIEWRENHFSPHF